MNNNNPDWTDVDAELAKQGMRRATDGESGWYVTVSGGKIWATDAPPHDQAIVVQGIPTPAPVAPTSADGDWTPLPGGAATRHRGKGSILETLKAGTEADKPDVAKLLTDENFDASLEGIVKRWSDAHWDWSVNSNGEAEVWAGNDHCICWTGDIEDGRALEDAQKVAYAPMDIRFLLNLLKAERASNAALQAKVDALTRPHTYQSANTTPIPAPNDENEHSLHGWFNHGVRMATEGGEANVEIAFKSVFDEYEHADLPILPGDYTNKEAQAAFGKGWFSVKDSPAPNGGETAAEAPLVTKKGRVIRPGPNLVLDRLDTTPEPQLSNLQTKLLDKMQDGRYLYRATLQSAMWFDDDGKGYGDGLVIRPLIVANYLYEER
jgi:hypothetical protein